MAAALRLYMKNNAANETYDALNRAVPGSVSREAAEESLRYSGEESAIVSLLEEAVAEGLLDSQMLRVIEGYYFDSGFRDIVEAIREDVLRKESSAA